MHLFKFNYTGGTQTLLDKGESIEGYDSAMWIERYREPGEFEIKAKLSTGLHLELPPETLISHMDTYEVMIVESIEIEEEEDEDPVVTISGRDFSSFLEVRVAGGHLAFDYTTFELYYLPPDHIEEQITTLIYQAIDFDFWNPQLNFLVGVSAINLVSPATGIVEARTIERGKTLDRIQELLPSADLGIRTIRRNSFGVIGSPTETYIAVYKGEDKTSDVVFSYDRGDIVKAGYLESIRGYANCAIVTSRWYNTIVLGAKGGYARRFIHVDASDLDSAYGTPPADIIGEVSWIGRLQTRGEEALFRKPKLEIIRADISPVSRYEYRRDFNLGDLVRVDGNFGAIADMRVVEYTEIQDDKGESGHPTLELPRELE